MKPVVLLAVLALAAPSTAAAKEPITISVCGATSCASLGTIEGNPFSDGRTEPARPAAPGPYYRIRLASEGERWTIFYVPQGDLLALPYREWMNWEPLEGPVAPALRKVVRRLEPLPAPTVTQARANGRVLPGDPNAYLRVLEGPSRSGLPGHPQPIRIRLSGPPSPWTNVDLLEEPDAQPRLAGRNALIGAALLAALLLPLFALTLFGRVKRRAAGATVPAGVS
jgi:hypothetical protein